MAGLKDAVGKKMTKDVKFMGLDVTISKLSVGQVQELQSLSAGADEQQEDKLVDILLRIIRLSVAEAADISDEEFSDFPLDELSKLSNEIMRFSGVMEKGK